MQCVIRLVPFLVVALLAVPQSHGDDKKPHEVIEKLQGKWTVTRGKQRWVKEFKGSKETFTVFDGDNPVYGHSHSVKIETKEFVQICTTSGGEVTIGPRKGEKQRDFSFIIKVEGDLIFEAVGMLTQNNPGGLKPEVIVWKRVIE